jgi:putative acetyltransferase
LRVRAAAPEDIADLAALASRSYQAAFASILDDAVLRSRDAASFEARFAICWPHMTVVVADNGIWGFLLMMEGHIDMLFMDPAATGKGAGALLLRDAETRGARSLECFRDNHRARSFYERNGWTLTRAYERDFAGKLHSFVYYEKPRP